MSAWAVPTWQLTADATNHVLDTPSPVTTMQILPPVRPPSRSGALRVRAGMSNRATLLIVGAFALFALALTVSLVSQLGDLAMREPADVLGELLDDPPP
jgi:hypothetical protein